MNTYDTMRYVLDNTEWNFGTLHKNERVLTDKETSELLTINKEIGKMSKTPTKHEYEKALEVVQKYEDRQKDLVKLNKDLGYCLQRFDQVKFDVNESKKEVTFTGVTKDGKLKLTKSVARHNDKFEQVIGKLICVKKALGEDIEYIDKFVERENHIGINIPITWDDIKPSKATTSGVNLGISSSGGFVSSSINLR